MKTLSRKVGMNEVQDRVVLSLAKYSVDLCI